MSLLSLVGTMGSVISVLLVCLLFRDYDDNLIDRMLMFFGQKFVIAFFVISFFASILSYPGFHQLIGLHNLEFEETGTHCYFVTISNEKHSYTLPAEISIEEESTDTSHKIRRYYIEKVYFSNGGFLQFDERDYVQIGKTYSFYDQDEQLWDCVLLNQHAFSPYIQETNHAPWYSVVFFFIGLAANGFLIIVIKKHLSTK